MRQNLKFLAKRAGCNNSDLAKMAGVSRQMVSQWMNSKDCFVNIGTKSLKGLCDGLQVPADMLLGEIPGLRRFEQCSGLLLWDRIYPDAGSFYAALMRRETAAVARLVEVFGLFEGEKVLGKRVWQDFERYADRIPPARRRGLQALVAEVLSIPT